MNVYFSPYREKGEARPIQVGQGGLKALSALERAERKAGFKGGCLR